MKKFMIVMLIIGSCGMYATDMQNDADVMTSLDKEVVGTNRETLEERNVQETEVDINKANVSKDSTESFSTEKKSGEDKIKIVQKETSETRTTSTKSKKGGSGIWKVILGVVGVAALVIAL